MQLSSQALHKGTKGGVTVTLTRFSWTGPSWYSARTCHLLRETFQPGLGKKHQPVSQAA